MDKSIHEAWERDKTRAAPTKRLGSSLRRPSLESGHKLCRHKTNASWTHFMFAVLASRPACPTLRRTKNGKAKCWPLVTTFVAF